MHRRELLDVIRRCFSDEVAEFMDFILTDTRVSNSAVLDKMLFPNCYEMGGAIKGLVSVMRWTFLDGSTLEIVYDTRADSCKLFVNHRQNVTLVGAETEEDRNNLYAWKTWTTAQTVVGALADRVRAERIVSYAELVLQYFRVYTVHLMLTGACARSGFALNFDASCPEQTTLWNADLVRVYGSMLGLQKSPFHHSGHAMPFMTELFPNT